MREPASEGLLLKPARPAIYGNDMEENLRWLWYAFGAAWIIHILYLVSISSRASRLKEQLENLKVLLRQQESKREGDKAAPPR